MSAGRTPHVCLIDGSGLAHRANAMARPRQAASGAEIGAVWLFSQMLGKLLRRMALAPKRLDGIGIFFDPDRDSLWRRKLHAGYKAHRPDTAPDFTAQVAWMVQLCADLGMHVARIEGLEADDLIASETRAALAEGARVSILSQDKDLMQLIEGRVWQMDPMRNLWFDAAAVRERIGVPPARIADFLALCGDAGDGVPGVRGVGPATAKAMVAAHGDLESILAVAPTLDGVGARRIASAADAARLSYRLVALDADHAPPMPAPEGIDGLRWPAAFEASRIDPMIDGWRQTALLGPQPGQGAALFGPSG